MPSERLYREIQTLERQIQLVLNENKRLSDDLRISKEENNRLQEKMKSQEENISAFQNQMKANNLVNNKVVSEGDSAELKATIDGYIKEIDNCIAHLAE